MALLILASASGSPGVTTLAVGLALSWPRSVLLADCDPAAHQSVLAGYLMGQSPQGKGLLRVAEAHRDGRPLREVVLDQTMPLTEQPEPRRWFLPGFSRPGSAALFGGVWPDLTHCFAGLDDIGIDVILDSGRVATSTLPTAMAEQASLTCMVMRSSLRSVMSARVHLPGVVEAAGSLAGTRVGLVVVGPGQPYGTSEISKTLELPVVATVADDPTSAAHLSDGRPRSRRYDTSPLVTSLRATSDLLYRRLRRAAERVGEQAGVRP
jgi:hypothetical protein